MDYEIESDESLTLAVLRAVCAVNGCPPRHSGPLARPLNLNPLKRFSTPGPTAVPVQGDAFRLWTVIVESPSTTGSI